MNGITFLDRNYKELKIVKILEFDKIDSLDRKYMQEDEMKKRRRIKLKLYISYYNTTLSKCQVDFLKNWSEKVYIFPDQIRKKYYFILKTEFLSIKPYIFKQDNNFQPIPYIFLISSQSSLNPYILIINIFTNLLIYYLHQFLSYFLLIL